ncbi:tyrosinase cofactor [Streptomyces sp. NPDC017202]|uniref:apotyrosinase chaperone MelC1 n=1 Tax=Streptomyces sp. NPDC017202 TaxID=3364981 RepID=UPI0037AC994B
MPELSRRRALTGAAALAATVGAAGAANAAPGDHHANSPGSPTSPASAASTTSATSSGFPAAFDEVYKGRRIQGRPATGGGHHGGGHHGGGYAVFVDGVELHVMRNADGSWISVVSHYDPVPTPRAAARAAVDELQGARLLPFPTD